MKRIKLLNLGLELLVVIFGVTIAFWLSSWGEKQKAKKLQIEYLLSFKNDLEKDTLILGEHIDSLQVMHGHCGKLIECIYARDFDNDSLLTYSLSLFTMLEFIPHSATFKSLTTSGQLQTISDFELRKQLVDQYDITYTFLRTIDDLNQSQVYDYKMPFLHDNIVYSHRGIESTNVMTTPKYMNMTMSTFYFIDRKIKEYTKAKQNAKELIQKINKQLEDI